MHLLLLLCLFFFSAVGSAPTSNLLIQKIVNAMVAEKPGTDVEWSQFACYTSYCHFEDKNGCKAHCGVISKKTQENTFAYARQSTNKTECARKCVLASSADSQPVCARLCAIHYSYPDHAALDQAWLDLATMNHDTPAAWDAMLQAAIAANKALPSIARKQG